MKKSSAAAQVASKPEAQLNLVANAPSPGCSQQSSQPLLPMSAAAVHATAHGPSPVALLEQQATTGISPAAAASVLELSALATKGKAQHSPSAYCLSQRQQSQTQLGVFVADQSGSQLISPSLQGPGSKLPQTPPRAPAGLPVTPLSSHPVATDESTSADSSAGPSPSKQQSSSQTMLAADQATADVPTVQQPNSLSPSGAVCRSSTAAADAVHEQRLPLLDTSAVVLQFGNDVNEGRLLSPASISASQQDTPIRLLPETAVTSQLFNEGMSASALDPEPSSRSPRDVADSPHSLPALWPLAAQTSPAYQLYSSTASPEQPQPSPLTVTSTASISHFGNPVLSYSAAYSVPMSSPTKFCKAAEQLQSAVQQAAQLYAEASESSQHTAEGLGLQPHAWQTRANPAHSHNARSVQPADALVRRALRRSPLPDAAAAAKWVPQDAGVPVSTRDPQLEPQTLIGMQQRLLQQAKQQHVFNTMLCVYKQCQCRALPHYDLSTIDNQLLAYIHYAA